MRKHCLLLIAVFVSIFIKAQSLPFFHCIGNVDSNSAEIFVIADTIRGVHYWNAQVYSDHDGDREIETAHLLLQSNAVHLYKMDDFLPNTMYAVLIIYADTFVRDTLTSGKPSNSAKIKLKGKKNILVHDKPYRTKDINKLLFTRRTDEQIF